MSDPSMVQSFEAFNARFLSAEEVAKTFIAPEQYFRLVEANHTVLFGPRGSGKTTLLKMLQLRALTEWNGPNASEIRKKLAFHAIFLGTDVLWGSQLEAKCKGIADQEIEFQIRRTSFRLHLAIAFLNALAEAQDEKTKTCADLERFYINLSDTKQAEIADALSEIWSVGIKTSSFVSLRVSIRKQISDLSIVIDNLKRNFSAEVPEYIKLDPMTSIANAIDVVNAIIGTPEKKWAILCDELEIAPEIIRKELFSLLRSSYHGIIFKFSLFPHTSEIIQISGDDGGSANPSTNNDYEALNLSYPYRRSAFAFCENLLSAMVEAAGGGADITPVQVLGDGWFDGSGFGSENKAKLNSYKAPNGQIYKRSVLLRRVDNTFSKWLKEREFTLEDIDGQPEDKKAQFRKALPFILTRSEFIGPNKKLKSRKALNLYTGAYSLFSISEGNPRTFINLMRPLVREFCETGGTVKATSQTSSLEATIHRYKASLSALPTDGYGDIRSIIQLVNVIGSYFQLVQLRGNFSPEPPSTIEVDRSVPPSLASLVGRALNAGALVRMPLEASETGREPNHTEDIVGSRLRISYTLAPEFKLPLVSTRTVPLSNIIHSLNSAKKRRPDLFKQFTLPFHVDDIDE